MSRKTELKIQEVLLLEMFFEEKPEQIAHSAFAFFIPRKEEKNRGIC